MSTGSLQERRKRCWNLTCGHSSSMYFEHVEQVWCEICCATKEPIKKELNEFNTFVLDMRRHNQLIFNAKETLRKQLMKDVSEFFIANPYGSVDEFYNYIITTK